MHVFVYRCVYSSIYNYACKEIKGRAELQVSSYTSDYIIHLEECSRIIQSSVSLPICSFSAPPVGSQLSLISQPSMKSQSKLEVASSSSGRLNNCCIDSHVYTLCMLLKTLFLFCRVFIQFISQHNRKILLTNNYAILQ